MLLFGFPSSATASELRYSPDEGLGSTISRLYFPRLQLSFFFGQCCIDPSAGERNTNEGRGTEMKHFKTQERSHRQRRRQKHSGPLETLTPWQKVAKVAIVEASYRRPPEARVRGVKAARSTARLAAKPNEKGGRIQLLFDSFSQPACPGTRSAATRTRQMLYRAAPYQVDLQIELQPESNRLIVTGQLLDMDRPGVFARDVQVTLSNCGTSVATVVTNQYGEFDGEIENSGDLDISFAGRGEKPIVILLRGVLDPLS